MVFSFLLLIFNIMTQLQERDNFITELKERYLEEQFLNEELQENNLSPIELQNKLSKELSAFRSEAGEQGIEEFVDSISESLFTDKLSLIEIRSLVRRIQILEFFESTERKKMYLDYQNPEEIKAKLYKTIKDNLLYESSENKHKVNFLTFKERLEHVFFRFVLTAHPVYPFTEELMFIQSQLISGVNDKGKAFTDIQKKNLFQKIMEGSFKPEENLSIEREFEISMKAIQNMREVLFDFRKIALTVAQKAFPKQWSEINVQLLQLASWVCYDTDGRNDINQFQSFRAAYEAKYDELLFLKNSIERLDSVNLEILQDKLQILKLELQAEINLIHEELGLLEIGVKNNLESKKYEEPLKQEKQKLDKEKSKTESRYFREEEQRKKALNAIQKKIDRISIKIEKLEDEGVLQISKFESRVNRNQEQRILNAEQIIKRLNDAIHICNQQKQDDSIDYETYKLNLVSLRSEISNGLCNALIHMRTGALRFCNAASSALKDKNQNDIFKQGHSESSEKQTFSTKENTNKMNDLIGILKSIKEISKKKGQVLMGDQTIRNEIEKYVRFVEVDINLKKIDNHEVTVIKFFATIAEMFKYIDSKTPIRFLISEFDHEFPYLTALFFAKFFEIDEKTEICPLIEFKDIVQEKGFNIINQLLNNEHVVDYIRQQGRFYIQFGFSDGGRQTTQFSFSDASDLLRRQTKELLKSKGLEEIDLVCFPTGGESSERARNLFSFKDTLEHFSPPLSRCTVEDKTDFQNTIEQTFQGLDGQFWFLQPEVAGNILYQALNFSIQKPNLKDAYYKEKYACFLDEWHRNISDTCYKLLKEKGHAQILDLFEFIDADERRGSRPVVRERERYSGDDTSIDAEKKRAINYTSVWQNLNYKIQILAGVGSFLSSMNRQQRETFYELYEESILFKREIDNILRAYSMVDIYILEEYLKSKTPETYEHLAELASSNEMKDKLLHTASKIKKYSNEREHFQVKESFKNIKNDFKGGKFILEKLISQKPEVMISEKHKEHMNLLHCLRISIYREIKRRSADLPRFTPKGGITYEGTMHLFNEGQIAESIEDFKLAFPKAIERKKNLGIQIMEDQIVDYSHYHKTIFDPILRLNDEFINITSAISLCEDGWG